MSSNYQYVPTENNWLNLRFAFDAASRNPILEQKFLDSIQEMPQIHILDVGCGSGANFVHLAPKLIPSQHWTLIDRDPGLINEVTTSIQLLSYQLNEGQRQKLKRLSYRAIQQDFLEISENETYDVIVANAVFDLNSEGQFHDFTQRLLKLHHRPKLLYFTMNLDEPLQIRPFHKYNDFFLNLFHQHMLREQDFGRAMGPKSANKIRETLKESSFVVEEAESHWKIDREHFEFLSANFEFIKNATFEMIQTTPEKLESWTEWINFQQNAIRNGEVTLQISHKDILAKLS